MRRETNEYLAEGETPDGATVCHVGVEAADPADDPDIPGDWRASRSRRNRLRHLCCAGRTGAKIQPDSDGGLLIESAA